MQDPVLFAFTVLAILCTPGPTNSLLAAAGATAGLGGSRLLIPPSGGGDELDPARWVRRSAARSR